VDQFEALGTGLEGVPVPAVLSDLATGATIGANAAAVELLGRPVDELIGSDVLLFVHPEERAPAASGVAALAGGAVDAFQVRNRRVVRADGAAVAVDISGRRLESETRRLALWVLAPAEQEIAVGHAGRPDEVVLAVTDHDWQVEYVNADARLLGPARESLVGTALLGLVHPSAAAELLEAASRAVAHRMTVSLATRLRSGKDVWTERKCLLVPMCEHDPPRLGIVVTAIVATPGDALPEVIAAQVRHTALDTHAADALGTLAAMTTRPGFPELSARQIEILSRVVQGDAVDDIAAALYLSASTVRNHLTALYRKFGVHSRAGLLAELLRTSSPPNLLG
jgi:DNA-binding CsgD family transcriptional regulator